MPNTTIKKAPMVFEDDFAPTLSNALKYALAKHPEREYLVSCERRMRFRDVERESARLARGLLSVGIGKGTRVGLLMPNCADWILSFFGIARAGGLTVTLSTFFQAAEISWALRHNDIDTLLVSAKYMSNDYIERLERAIPELKQQRTPNLKLRSHPYLRRIIVWGECDRPWALQGPDSLHRAIDESPQVDDAFLAEVERNISSADLLVIVCTSGTTSEPKAVVHSHGNGIRAVRMFTQFITHRPEDRIYSGHAFFWIGGLNLSILPSLFVGNAICFAPSARIEDIVDTISREQVTLLTLWPAQAQAIASEAARRGLSLAHVRRGIGPQRDDLGQMIPADRQSRAMGMTETFGMHSMERYFVPAPCGKAENWGRCVPGMQRRVIDPELLRDVEVGRAGELYLRGQALMQGYYKCEREEVFTADGWFATGDLVSEDEDGFIYFHGRLTEMIKTSGANVSPREVEMVLARMSGVREAIVFGMPHPLKGEIVLGAVVPVDGTTLEETQLIEALKLELSPYKVPKAIFQLGFDEIPRTGSQKVRKHNLRDVLRGRILERFPDLETR